MSTPAVERKSYVLNEYTKYIEKIGFFTLTRSYGKEKIYLSYQTTTNLSRKKDFSVFVDNWYRINHPNISCLIDAWYDKKKGKMGWVTELYIKLFDKYPNIIIVPDKLKYKWCAQLLSAIVYLNKIKNWKVFNLSNEFIYLDSEDNIKLGGLIIFYESMYSKIPNHIISTKFIFPKYILSHVKKSYIWMWAFACVGMLTGLSCYSPAVNKHELIFNIENNILPNEVLEIDNRDIKNLIIECLTSDNAPDVTEIIKIFTYYS